MKTSEFIKQVEELGYEVKEGVGYEIYHAGNIVSRVYKMHERFVDTSFSEFRYLNNRDRMDLLDLIVEYAKTPLEEREEPKRYYLRPKGMIVLGDASFSYNPYGEYWYLENDPSTDHVTTFTIKELEDLGIDVKHYDSEQIE